MVRDAEAYGKYMEYLRNSDTPIGEILRTPPSDLSQCKKEAEEFEAAMRIEHEKDRAIIAKALAEARELEMAKTVAKAGA